MSYHDDYAHPVALTPGKVLVEAEWVGERSGNRLVIFAGEWTICADPATVHPAALLKDLRAENSSLREEMVDLLWRKKEMGDAEDALREWDVRTEDADIAENVQRLIKEITELRAKLAAAEAVIELRNSEVSAFIESNSINADRAMRAEVGRDAEIAVRHLIQEERDTARRELEEALAWMRARMNGTATNYDGRAILARHAPERREGERRHLPKCAGAYFKQRRNSDRRKQPEVTYAESVNWQQVAEKNLEHWKAAEAECERLKEDLARVRKLASEDSSFLNAERHAYAERTDKAEAKLAAVRNWTRDNTQDMQDLRRILDSPARPASEPKPAIGLDWVYNDAQRHYAWDAEQHKKMQARIQALEAAQQQASGTINAADTGAIGAMRESVQQQETEPWPSLTYHWSDSDWKDWAKTVQRRIEANEREIDALKARQG